MARAPPSGGSSCSRFFTDNLLDEVPLQLPIIMPFWPVVYIWLVSAMIYYCKLSVYCLCFKNNIYIMFKWHYYLVKPKLHWLVAEIGFEWVRADFSVSVLPIGLYHSCFCPKRAIFSCKAVRMLCCRTDPNTSAFVWVNLPSFITEKDTQKSLLERTKKKQTLLMSFIQVSKQSIFAYW